MEFTALPNRERAVVDLAKLRDYCLNPCHQDGKHKARVFKAALGVGRADAEWLRERILEAAATRPGVLTATTSIRNSLRARLCVDHCFGIGGYPKRLDRAAWRGLRAIDDMLREIGAKQ